MRLRFVGQPFAAHPNLIDFIDHARDDGFDELKIAVAWAKRSGLGRVWDALNDFRAQGGRVLLIVGVSEGGATKEGLELALGIADEGYVFHDPRRTFHPKVYLASSSGKRSLMVGSSNLTAGGLSWNYEASVWVDLDAGEGEGVTDEVNTWFDTLIAETDSCSPLTAELIEDLEASGDIIIGSESWGRRVQRRKSDAPEDNDSVIVATISGLFKPVMTGLRKLPRLSTKISKSSASSSPKLPASKSGHAKSRTTAVNGPAKAGPAPFPLEDVQRRWVKQLDNTAAQQVKSASSNPTGNLRLSQETAAIDHKHYFRDDFFGGLPWTPTEGKSSEQEVIVGFHTWIDGQDLGVQDLRLSHDPHRVSGQGNVPTVLHWGVLSRIMRSTNYIGFFVSIERTLDGRYNLVISQAPRGDYRV
ncbi:phospholipase D-like domain-containing protein [Propionibacterium freudenreichii]|uniref:phospholipase D-like domain-containing protein n=1 Tax=Propionibacterium freudenreichii TaxID=1744 RepID=UPI0018C1FC9C|nr:phospholipase D family protein [Propionibacterium freudenreichii]MDK9674742.1 phospholipase D family protein [Propionibacterium freudenreichii]